MKDCAKILIVDDELGIRDLLSSELGSRDYRVVTASNGAEAVEKVKKEKFHLVIGDIKMPKMGGLEMLDAIKKLDPDVEVIVSTGYGTIETAVDAMKKGAYDFIQKPFNLDEMLALVERALEKIDLKTLVGIYESSKAVFSSIKLDALLPIIVELSAKILKADDASIMLPGPDGRLKLMATAGLEDEKRKEGCVLLGERVAGRVAQGKSPVVITGPLEQDPRFSDIASLRAIKSSVVFPLILRDEILGVLNVNRTLREEPFAAAELRHATILGLQLAQALHNAKLYQELEKKMEEIREMQGQLIQSAKMAAVGQLAAGVSHEINNPLTGILGFTEMLLRGDGLSEQQRQDLESILHQSKRCRKIVQSLLQLSRKTQPKVESVSLEKILGPTLELVLPDFRLERIGIEADIVKDLPPIIGDPSQLEQVFLNIITNARQAMEGRKNARLRIRADRNGNYVAIRFEDNGCGIAPQHLGRIFDPFFSTKPVGQGTGLGLSISCGIIHEHGGTLRVESQADVGTTVIIELPADRPSKAAGKMQ